jgi:hypothetical protein
MDTQPRKDNRTSTSNHLTSLGYNVLFITRADIEVYYFCVGPLGRHIVFVQAYKSTDQDLVKQTDTVKWHNEHICSVNNGNIIFPLDRENGIKYTTKRLTVNGEYYISSLDNVTKNNTKVIMEVDEFFANKGNKEYTVSVESIKKLNDIIYATKEKEDDIKKYSALLESTFRDIRNARIQCQKHLKANEYQEVIAISEKLAKLDETLQTTANNYSQIAKNILSVIEMQEERN